ncbi:histone PARylation factor 1-like [Scaptodrosophila lebanonensis]|uniref:Histone PARylation factor 1-like n=1 Tax=Drosophila lebanonensis TaxID=7225 RepID=A0A6J2TA50_DROLE|nr:histone PARylation factor 1-like [Scaptodrosophila lebanonensis]
MPKQDCKYWDKCYQRNEAHLEKYNHPPKDQDGDRERSEADKVAPKRKADGKEQDKPNTSRNSIDEDHNPPAEHVKDVGAYESETAELHKEALSNIAGKNYMEVLEKRIRLSVQQEYDSLCETNEFIRHKFLVEMPPDFYEFWTFINTLKKDTTKADALKHIETVFQLQLVGPFEFLAGNFHKAKIGEPGDYLRHWRFYYDPPEFQTVFVRRGTGIHYGYWRDEPQDKDKLLVARNDMTRGCEFEFVAGNIFDAFLYYLQNDFVGTPFSATQVSAAKKALQKHISDNSVELAPLDRLQRERNKRVVAKTFHRLGIVVPFERKTQQGYRPLTVSDAELKKMLSLLECNGVEDSSAKQAVLEKLQPVANAANIAVDECDFGTALELGIDLFCSGYKELHMLASSLIVPAYSLLSRPQFIAIAKAHMDRRSREIKLSIFDVMV